MRTTILGGTLVLALAAARASGAVTEPGFDETVVAANLSIPTALAFLPDGRMLVVELAGRLALVDQGVVTPLLQVPSLAFCPPGDDLETGLLGIAVDPDFANTRHVFLYRTKATSLDPCLAAGRTNEVVRATLTVNDTVSASSITPILTGIRSDTGYHNGGCLRFGPDGKLYVGTGDTGLGDFLLAPPGQQTNPYTQDKNELSGKILRIEKTGAIPTDNPFVGMQGARGEVFAYGFRNPWRFSFDPVTQRLWAGDVGEETVEEIDVVVSGGNYSWPHCEGNLPGSCGPGEQAPVFTYLHAGNAAGDEASVTGGGFAPNGFGALAGKYFFGDYESSVISRLTPNGARDGVTGGATGFVTGADGPVDIVFGPDGALYYVAINTGEVRRVGVPGGGVQLLPGKQLVLRGGAKKSLALSVSGAIAIGGPGDNPTTNGGALSVIVDGVSQTYPLPASNWKLLGKPTKAKGFKYDDKKGLLGPIRKVVVKTGKSITATGSGNLHHTLGATAPSGVDVALYLGGRRYCTQFGGKVKFTAAKQFKATNSPAPAVCPADT